IVRYSRIRSHSEYRFGALSWIPAHMCDAQRLLPRQDLVVQAQLQQRSRDLVSDGANRAQIQGISHLFSKIPALLRFPPCPLDIGHVPIRLACGILNDIPDILALAIGLPVELE